jgi:hypothetical protein
LSNLQKPDEKCHIRLIFSTVALGMGADLKHVQRVIHAGPPTSLESIFVSTFNITLKKFTISNTRSVLM